MQRILALALLGLTTTGCATESGVELPTGEAGAIVHDWTAVLNLEPNARILVEADARGIIDGRMFDVSPDQIRLITKTGLAVMDRTHVARVVAIKNHAKTGAKQGAMIGVLIGGLVVAASGGEFWFPLVVDPPLLAGLGAAGGALAHRQLLVYERQ